MRKKALCGIASVLSIVMGITAYAGIWKQNSVGRWYEHDDGSYCQNGWDNIDNAYYYFDENGYLLTNTTTPDGYKVDADGKWIENSTSNVSQSGIRSEILDADFDEPIVQIDNLLIRYDCSVTLSDFVNYVEQQGYTTEYDSDKRMDPGKIGYVRVYKNGSKYFTMSYINESDKIARANDDNVVIYGFLSANVSKDASRNTWLPTGFNLNGDGLYYDESLFHEHKFHDERTFADENLIMKPYSFGYDTKAPNGKKGKGFNYVYMFFDADTLECKRVWYESLDWITSRDFYGKLNAKNAVDRMGAWAY